MQSGSQRRIPEVSGMAATTRLRMWTRGVIDSWYNGKLFNLYRAGQAYKDHPIGSRIFAVCACA